MKLRLLGLAVTAAMMLWTLPAMAGGELHIYQLG